MRIDQPSGSRATLEGSFSGSFTGSFLGEVQGLSSSFGAVYEHIDQISKSIDNTVQENSSSTSSSLFELSSSFSSSLTSVSNSVSSSIYQLDQKFSSSLVNSVRELYSTIDRVSGSLTSSLGFISQSISGTIFNLSSSFDITIKGIVTSSSGSVLDLSESTAHSLEDIRKTYVTTASFLAYSRSAKEYVDQADSNLSSSIGVVSSSFSSSLSEVSQSISSSLIGVSRSIDETINFEHLRTDQISASFDQTLITMSQTIDNTYYKSGSNASFTNLEVSGTTILGDLIVTGSFIKAHTEEVEIKDKFVEIASGSPSPLVADEAGFGIWGTNASLKYRYNGGNSYFSSSLPISGPYFYGTASKAEYARTISDDSIIAESIVELYNLAVAKTGSLEAQGTIMLNTGARKTFQTCIITSSIQKIYLQLSDTIQLDFEHRVLFKNNTTGSVEVNPPAHTLMPAAIEGRIDGGYANNTGNYFTVRPFSILLMTYYSVDGESIIISELEEFKEN